MKPFRLYTALLFVSVLMVGCSRNNSPTISDDPSKTIHVYALMGQSNMIGGNAIEFERITNPRIKSLNLADEIVVATDPLMSGGSIHPELNAGGGVGPGTSFADNMIHEFPEGHEIILVNCSRRSSMREQINDNIYARNTYYQHSLLNVCLDRVKVVLMDDKAVFEGILFWQGEGDVRENFDYWSEGLLKIKATFEQLYGNIEFVFAQLGINNWPYLNVNGMWDKFKEKQKRFSIQHGIKMIKTDDIMTLYKGNVVHADHFSQIEIGYRFYKKFIQ